jgi:hypothetical protein
MFLKLQVESELQSHERLKKERTFEHLWFQPIWEGYSKPWIEVVVYVNVPKEGEMATRKESKEKTIAIDEAGSTLSKLIPN